MMNLGEGVLSGQPAPFDYTVPSVEGAAPWVRFFASPSVGDSLSAGYGWHERRVALPTTGAIFDVPAPVSLTAPAEGAAIGASTLFRWSAGPAGGKYALNLVCDEWSEGPLRRNVIYRGVETAAAEVSLPSIPGVAVPSGVSCSWSVAWLGASDPASETRGSWSAGRAATAQ